MSRAIGQVARCRGSPAGVGERSERDVRPAKDRFARALRQPAPAVSRRSRTSPVGSCVSSTTPGSATRRRSPVSSRSEGTPCTSGRRPRCRTCSRSTCPPTRCSPPRLRRCSCRRTSSRRCRRRSNRCSCCRRSPRPCTKHRRRRRRSWRRSFRSRPRSCRRCLRRRPEMRDHRCSDNRDRDRIRRARATQRRRGRPRSSRGDSDERRWPSGGADGSVVRITSMAGATTLRQQRRRWFVRT